MVEVNRRHIETTGGEYFGYDNLKERGSLECVLDEIRYPLFGVELYPTLVDKAARLTWSIAHEHVFWDACKRTGMSVLLMFLQANGFQLNITKDEIIDTALRVAGEHPEENFSYDDFVQWIRDRIELGRKS